MNVISTYKRIITVFQQYGIKTTGIKKFATFYNDLKMDPVFVMGLIFELELVAKRELVDDQIAMVDSPAQLVTLLINARSENNMLL
ncbi:hypothetical protein [Anditalea andensis]|uniref:Acyl carrier protein n=1 Tax=Anditalea andensis TaxID=1048983 RepID=A0A074L2T0_9BACT|nr:hypothetical protein [Anditalea andensis]KEO74143.1 hypothetical protein EL17_08360 [Anditalea andensis]